jgi:aldose 1-epimerase
MAITRRPFGVSAGGEAVTCYTLRSGGMEVRILDYGGIVTHLILPDRRGRPVDVVLGYDDLAAYETDEARLGALVGRYANRIRGAAFELNGETVRLTPNDGPNHLHGTLGRRVFRAETGENRLRLTCRSGAGEDGLPGNLDVAVTYVLGEDNTLTMDYEAVSDADTVLNLTNHSYFNLAGHDSGTAEGQLLQIAADRFLEIGADLCPTGRFLPAEGTMDFRRPRPIGRDLTAPCEQMALAGGYDHCYVLRPGEPWAARAWCPETGIALTLRTTQPGLQLYTGNDLAPVPPGKGGAAYGPRQGFALEAQGFPCAPNYPHFPSALLRAGEVYRHRTALHLAVEETME